jgi:hypothetical protein
MLEEYGTGELPASKKFVHEIKEAVGYEGWAVDLYIAFSRSLRFNIKSAMTVEHFKWSVPTL